MSKETVVKLQDRKYVEQLLETSRKYPETCKGTGVILGGRVT